MTDHASSAGITILNHRFHPFVGGGVERRMWEVSRALAARGWDVTVLTENHGDLPAVEEVAAGVTVRRLPPLRSGPLWRAKVAVQSRRAWWWRQAVVAHAPRGPIWANGYPAPTLGAILAGRRRDVIFNPSTCIAATNRIAATCPAAAHLAEPQGFAWMDRLAYRLAPHVVVGSRNLQQQLLQHYGSHGNISIVPHGVTASPFPQLLSREAARRQLGLPGEAWVAGFVGRLDPCKDLGFWLEAVAQWGARRDRWLLIAGEGPERPALHRKAEALGVADRIIWTGELSDPSVAYAAMNVLVLPSVYETFGNVVLEAMAAGRPVIARRPAPEAPCPVLTASDELIRHGETGLLVDAHAPADLADALERLAASPDHCAAMGDAARAAVLEQTWAAAIDRYEALLSDWGFAIPAQHDTSVTTPSRRGTVPQEGFDDVQRPAA